MATTTARTLLGRAHKSLFVITCARWDRKTVIHALQMFSEGVAVAFDSREDNDTYETVEH